MNYTHWHQTAHTSQIRIILQPTSNIGLHASLWNIPEQEMAHCYDTVSVSRAYMYSNHVAWILGKKSWPCQGQDFSLKAKAKAKTWGAKAKAKTLSSKAKAKAFMRCPRGSSRPRPGLEDNKTDNEWHQTAQIEESTRNLCRFAHFRWVVNSKTYLTLIGVGTVSKIAFRRSTRIGHIHLMV